MPRWPAYLLAGAAAAFALPAMTTPHPRETPVTVVQEPAHVDPHPANGTDRQRDSDLDSQN